MNLLESTPPKVISPFVLGSVLVGAKKIPTSLVAIIFSALAVSVIVGIVGVKRAVPMIKINVLQHKHKHCG